MVLSCFGVMFVLLGSSGLCSGRRDDVDGAGDSFGGWSGGVGEAEVDGAAEVRRDVDATD